VETRTKESGSDAELSDKPNISLKLSSLYSQFDPVNESGTKEAVNGRLRKILRFARKTGAFANIDMEQYEDCGRPSA
jgi:RHH-type proline utilization regulon transcriptional repressor/proline dehydrogenase/delta 1-pyrroline-5-carboxylate dehydrogenase